MGEADAPMRNGWGYRVRCALGRRLVMYSAILLAMSLAVSGCNERGKRAKDLPKLTELAPASASAPADYTPNTDSPLAGPPLARGAEGDTSATALPAPVPPMLGGPPIVTPNSPVRHRLVVQRLIFDRNDPQVAFSLGLLDEAKLTAKQKAIANAAELALVVSDRQTLPLTMVNMPKPVGGDVVRIRPKAQFSAVTTISNAPARQRVAMPHEDGTTEPILLRDGRYQLLLNLLPSLDGPDASPVLELLPHHHRPEVSLVARTADEQLLDGTAFEALHLKLPMTEGQVFVLYHRPTPNETNEAGGEAAGNGEPPAKNPAPTVNGQPVRPMRRVDQAVPIGQAMLTGLHRRKPVQIVVLITSEPIDARLPNRQSR